MRIVEQSVTLEWVTPSPALAIERAARTCYRSEDRIGDGTAAALIAHLIKRGHTAMLEHASASLRFTCDRAIANELTRHRMASFAQESTRYCRYADGIAVIRPPGLDDRARFEWDAACERAEFCYLAMIDRSVKPEIARSVLPLCTATQLVCTANFREWLHILSLRTAPNAHPQMRALMGQARALLAETCPEVFGQEAQG